MKQKSLLFVPAVFFCFSILAQAKVIRKDMPPPMRINRISQKAFYDVQQLSGKWQEVKRTAIGSKTALDFSDTLLMKFDSNRVEIKDATSMRMTMRGEAYIDPPYNLIAAGDEYVIQFLDSQKLIMNDGSHVKELQRKKMFYFETLGKLRVRADTINNAIDVDQKLVQGKWIVYRRQAPAGLVDNNAVVIKSIEIFPSNTIGSAQGQVACYKSDIIESLPCRIVYGNANILVITDKYVWEFDTYKADGKEFVFGEVGSLVYYSKH